MPKARKKRSAPNRPARASEYAVSDEAAAYIADALMDLALQFEAAHLGQIRRHWQAVAQRPDDDPGQPGPFDKSPPF